MEELTRFMPEDLLRAARELLLEYGRFVLAQPGAGRFCFGTLEKEASGLPASFIEQGGGSLLALVHGEPAGFVAWRIPEANAAIVPDCWELKRLWVRPTHRGLGLGRALTQAVLDRAVAAERKAVYLDTAPESMGAAYRLYLEMGFKPCNPYNDNPVEGLAWMVKSL
jgi:ribosomal protein S18 acetylase RimI-like enzyme